MPYLFVYRVFDLTRYLVGKQAARPSDQASDFVGCQLARSSDLTSEPAGSQTGPRRMGATLRNLETVIENRPTQPYTQPFKFKGLHKASF